MRSGVESATMIVAEVTASRGWTRSSIRTMAARSSRSKRRIPKTCVGDPFRRAQGPARRSARSAGSSRSCLAGIRKRRRRARDLRAFEACSSWPSLKRRIAHLHWPLRGNRTCNR
jgi:hypothetical protein